MTDASKLIAVAPVRYRSLARALLIKLQSDSAFVDEVAHYLASKITDQDLAEEFAKLSEDTKIDACIENMVIGLTSGSLDEKEIKQMIK